MNKNEIDGVLAAYRPDPAAVQRQRRSPEWNLPTVVSTGGDAAVAAPIRRARRGRIALVSATAAVVALLLTLWSIPRAADHGSTGAPSASSTIAAGSTGGHTFMIDNPDVIGDHQYRYVLTTYHYRGGTDTFQTWTSGSGEVWEIVSSFPNEIHHAAPATDQDETMLSLAQVRALPTDVAGMLDYFRKKVGPENLDNSLFSNVGDLLRRGVVPLAQRTALVGALATDPEVSVTRGRVDSAGRAADSYEWSYPNPCQPLTIFIDPATSTLLEERDTGEGGVVNSAVYSDWTVLNSLPSGLQAAISAVSGSMTVRESAGSPTTPEKPASPATSVVESGNGITESVGVTDSGYAESPAAPQSPPMNESGPNSMGAAYGSAMVTGSVPADSGDQPVPSLTGSTHC